MVTQTRRLDALSNYEKNIVRLASKSIICANGDFPTAKVPLALLFQRENCIACDGALNQLIQNGISPDILVGDFDSVDSVALENFRGRIVHNTDTESNDLSKAIAVAQQDDLSILAASGGREDHLIANIFLLFAFNQNAKVQLFTDRGFFQVLRMGQIPSFAGQAISFFSPNPKVAISTKGCEWELNKRRFANLNEGSLNRSVSDNISIEADTEILVFQSYS